MNEHLLRTAKATANTTLRNPYSIGGRGSMLEQHLARTILALLEEADSET